MLTRPRGRKISVVGWREARKRHRRQLLASSSRTLIGNPLILSPSLLYLETYARVFVNFQSAAACCA
ncbi:uncharacterized protein LY79DRAFT_556226 [Colletotrichum navitas]|uniref:Uncharacterized protein n=1 Tax=Colletotrichum navitas TaxID=681940 RepID=A0AAD8PX67_9PEZI|nr:uncharacterized protein LY79DRAFT_556226 [Colletotrichum navitas]KAK1589753.1 hypothetical protein LY79DRAFT_556226 [Colletotrichum navitas]